MQSLQIAANTESQERNEVDHTLTFFCLAGFFWFTLPAALLLFVFPFAGLVLGGIGLASLGMAIFRFGFDGRARG